jgi:hypothetical protein
MPRHLSFALTTQQFRDGSKTVTRRLGWAGLQAGTCLEAVKQSQGLKRGEKVERLGPIRVVDVRREPLRRMLDDAEYGFVECVKEGFPGWPSSFVSFFCAANNCKPETVVTRIEFERL